jgi:hypothetical protein
MISTAMPAGTRTTRRIAIEQGHCDSIDAERLVGELSTQGISEVQVTIVASIARFLAQEVFRTEGQYSRAIASQTGQTVFLVEHILKMLAANGLIQFDGVHEGDLYVFSVSPELRRNLEDNK